MKDVAEVGVLVGRFQVDELHDGHKMLINRVSNTHEKVILFLGLSPARVTRNNPLDFESRKQMILSVYPNVNVLYIKDVPSDDVWSKNLDQQIRDLVGPMATVVLYGGRESFIDHYTGKYPTEEIDVYAGQETEDSKARQPEQREDQAPRVRADQPEDQHLEHHGQGLEQKPEGIREDLRI